LFLFARGLNNTEKFHLASNVDGAAGAFDDVLFKYKLKEQDVCKNVSYNLNIGKTNIQFSAPASNKCLEILVCSNISNPTVKLKRKLLKTVI
jgi:hypothetical protein